MTRARIDVVGLGPAGAELITAETAALLSGGATCVVRTTRHPAAADLGAASMDHHYEIADDFATVYAAIVDELVALAGQDRELVYAVPGSPRVAEHTVDLLVQRCAGTDIDVVVHAALSFIDLAWVRLGVDPLSTSPRLIDGHRFAVEAAGERGPLLVAQCHATSVLSDIKLAVDTHLDQRVTVLQRLGSPDERVFETALADLDREVEADHLTSIWVPELREPVARSFVKFEELTRRLRADCPWDAEQDHGSLRRYLLEESYEALEALDELDAALDAAEAAREANGESDGQIDDRVDAAYIDLEEELGDLLYQIFFHSLLAAEQGRFTISDVADGIHDKLHTRHPHVFGDTEASLESLPAQWEQAKREEKQRASVMDGIPAALPALLYASKVLKKGEAVGAIASPADPVGAVRSALEQLETSPEGASVGELLLAVVDLARGHGHDPETELRQAAVAVASRVRDIEAESG